MFYIAATKTSFFCFAMCKSLLEEPLCSGQEGRRKEREVPGSSTWDPINITDSLFFKEIHLFLIWHIQNSSLLHFYKNLCDPRKAKPHVMKEKERILIKQSHQCSTI